MQEQKVCPVCNKPVIRKCLTYCEAKCYAEARRKKVEVSCIKCSNVFTIRPFELARSSTHYCPNCREKWENRKPTERELTGLWLQCFFCSQPVYRPPYYYRRYLYTFCSKECRKAGWGWLVRAHQGLFGSKKDKNI